MNRLRLNPQTGRIAEQLPASAARLGLPGWISYDFDTDGRLSVTQLDDTEVAHWDDVVLAPRPLDPEFAYGIACEGCDGSLAATVDQRAQLTASEHTDHDTAPYAVRVHHPHNRDDDIRPPTFAAGTEVTFHGSTTGGVAGLVHATIERADKRDVDGLPVAGYIVAVEGSRGMFVPATAVHITDATPGR